MFIKLQRSKVSEKVYVHLVEGFRGSDGRPRQRIVRNYGELSALEAAEPGVLERLRAEAKEANQARKDAVVPIEVDCMRGRKDGEHPRNIGHFFLEAVYRRLGLHSFFKERGGGTLNDIVELLVYARVLAPASKLATYEGKDGYLRDFGFKAHDVYRALDTLDALAEEACLHVHRQVSKHLGRDARLVFYDVTNYYFECDEEDGLRKKGASKEKRHDPIVQMGLLIDSSGIPITYRLFEGNTHDAKTLVPVLEALKERYGFSRIIVVADKGLNSKGNIAWIDQAGDGYIVSQKVRGRVAPEIAEHIADREGWAFTGSGEFAYKSFVRTHTLANGHEVKEKVVCSWSAAYARREACKRGGLVEAVESLVACPARYEALNGFGRKRYVREVLVTEGGEAAKKVLAFDEGRFKADAALDGFYALITSEVGMGDLEVIESYRGLSRIEESFRVIKSDLEGRPVYVWTRPHINAHFLVCFLALVLVRALQVRAGYSLSAGAIKDALAGAAVTPLEKQIYVVEETTAAYKQLEESFGASLRNRYAPIEALRAYRKAVIRNA